MAASTSVRRVVVEADGGSRGNPGPAAYGALIRDADTGEVLAQKAESIGVATNNVAEYSGLIAGLELVADHAPDAEVEVRMDSKLVIEQMAGRWKVKHPDMLPLAIKAQSIAPFGVEWTWVPREKNKAADAILNDALDEAMGRTPKKRRQAPRAATTVTEPAVPVVKNPVVKNPMVKNPMAGWRDVIAEPPTTVILLRHGVTDNTIAKLFCGSGGTDPGLNEEGRAQAARAAAYLARMGGVDAVVSSPLQRTRDTAGIVARELGLDVATEPGIAEASFGDWDGLPFADVKDRWPDEIDAWLFSTSVAPPGGGETYDSVYARAQGARDRLLEAYPGKTVVAVSHATPIKMLVRIALDADMPVIHRLELAPASLTTIRWWPDGLSTLRSYAYVPD